MDEKKTDKMLEKEADKKDSLLQETIWQGFNYEIRGPCQCGY